LGSLYTLYGIVQFHYWESKLYLAEYTGIPLEIYSNVYPETADEVAKYLKHIKRGIRVSRARLLHELKTWNDKTLMTFAYDCAERAIKRENYIFKDRTRFFDALEFLKAAIDCIYYDKTEDIRRILKIPLDPKINYKIYLYDHIRSFENELFKDYYTGVIDTCKALYACFSHFYLPVYAAKDASFRGMTTSLIIGFFELESQGYVVPSWSLPKENEKELHDRIWYLNYKIEIDWQVKHLSKLLGEDIYTIHS
jgi:hypothetical protein